MADYTASSSTDICNLALEALKQPPIADIAENSTHAGICQRHYDNVRRSRLRAHTWNFAKTEAVLNRLDTAESASYSDLYTIPADWLALYSIGDVLADTLSELYDVRTVKDGSVYKRVIAIENSGEATLDVLYIRDVTDVTQFDPLFVEMFSYALALKIGKKISAKPSLLAQIRDELQDMVREANGVDGRERPPVRLENSKFLSARRNLGRKKYVTFDFE